MSSRQVVRVFSSKAPNTTVGEVALPEVFLAPIRSDIVHFVFYNLNKNRRQPYGVNKDAGMMYNAESWGTGRAVARIPRVGGSGTHRSGQGAFGNMCRGGRMFNPNAIWRRWQRKVNLTQRRHAVASAVAASAIPSLVLARGHRVNQVPEVPLVVDSLSIERVQDLIATLERLGLSDELNKVKETKKVRPGQGKYRNNRYRTRKGPLIVYSNEDRLIHRSARNVPGVETCHVDRLNLLQLAPGGHLGRLIVWTKPAFERLNHLFGTFSTPGQGKKGYMLERPLLTNANLARIINSNEVQSVVRPRQRNVQVHDRQKKNPLKNKTKMNFLNPYDAVRRQNVANVDAKNKSNRAERLKKRAAQRKSFKKAGQNFIGNYNTQINNAHGQSLNDYKEYIKSTKVGKDAMKLAD
jgi:large subunit ribosomal protein L4e